MICKRCKDDDHLTCIMVNGQSSTWCDCKHYDRKEFPSAIRLEAQSGESGPS